MASYRIRVSKDYTVFCSGHFIAYDGDQCEPLHGHNYRAAVSLEGALAEDAYVFNFVTLKRILRGICDRLDHRMLLPTHNPLIQVVMDTVAYTVSVGRKTYVFPAEDVVQLPVPNTTSECLASWIGGELLRELRARGDILAGVRAIEVEVEETVGQSATCRLELSAG
jgi:6-pyruvoyltetrahydropterin/6-carboxytetrahydropterin synthase